MKSTISRVDTGRAMAIAIVMAGVVAMMIGAPRAVRAQIERVDAPAPDFKCAVCLNSQPFRLSDLRGKVVLVDFWEYTCINCIRTFPAIKRWYALYHPLGLDVVAVHTPEFQFAHNPERVADAVKRFGLDFPVAVDSDYAIWNAFHNEAWPADYLIDAKGNVAYVHLGEGEYAEFEAKIQELLKQANPKLDFSTAKYRIPPDYPMYGSDCLEPTQETYLGFARGDSIANPGGEDRTGETQYAAPADIPIDGFALKGGWLASEEYVRHTTADKAPGGDSLMLHYRAKSVYIVAGSDDGSMKHLYVTQDGKPLAAAARGVDIQTGADGQTYLPLTGKRMYYVVNNPEFGHHMLNFSTAEPDVSLYSFTFGNNCENKFAHK